MSDNKNRNGLNLRNPWLLEKAEFEKLRFLQNKFANKPKMLQALVDKKVEEQITIASRTFDDYRIIGGKAVLEIDGVIFRREAMSSWLFGGTTVDKIMGQLNHAINNEKIKGIILEINSPGGEVDGVPELADMIYKLRGQKPIVAYVSHIGASAAYWIASAADKMIIQEAASVGSIGVYAEYSTGGDSDSGSVQIVSSISPRKVADLNTEEGVAQIQNHIDTLGEIFVSKISLYRGVEKEKVLNEFGKGDVKIGFDAVKAGMADAVGNYDKAYGLANLMIKESNEKTIDKTDSKSITSNNEIKKTEIKKPKGGGTMSNIKAELIAIDDEELTDEQREMSQPITKEFIETNFPEIADSFKNGGSEEENSRQEEIDQVETNNAEEAILKNEAKRDFSITAQKLAHSLLIKRQADSKTLINQRKADSEEVPNLVNSDTEKPSEENLVSAIQDGIKAGLKKRRK